MHGDGLLENGGSLSDRWDQIGIVAETPCEIIPAGGAIGFAPRFAFAISAIG